MKKIDKQPVQRSGGFIPQPVWLIGTRNEDGTPNFSTITWVSYAFGPPESLIVSMLAKRTKENILRTGEFTANLCSVEMAALADYTGAVSGLDGIKDGVSFDFVWGENVQAPVLDASPYVIECKVLQTHLVGDTHTFIAEMVSQLVDTRFGQPDDDSPEAYFKWLNANDIHGIDPLLYTWKYYRVGEKIGQLGELQ